METLHIIAWIYLGLGVVSFLMVLIDIMMGRYQAMPIMNLSWPITCAYSTFLGVFMYFKYARAAKTGMNMGMKESHACGSSMKSTSKKSNPMWVSIYISSTHCGSGCGLADICSEILIYFAGITIFGAALYASFFIDYGFALVFGLAFQYYNIKPMRPGLSAPKALWNALTADIWSLTSFQVGMYGWLIATYYMFSHQINASMAIYWFMMQVGLTIGLLTTYPINYILIKKGIKTPCA